jgi:phosphoglycerate dehydrogenase-like enzyme
MIVPNTNDQNGGQEGENTMIGIYHAHPDSLLPAIRDAAPKAQLKICAEWDALANIIDEIDVLLAFKFGSNPFPKDLILSSRRLRWIQLASAGVDHMVPFSKPNLVVTNASGIHGNTMAQFVIGALVHRLWNFERLMYQQRNRVWQRYDVGTLTGKTMVIVGAGHIGTAIGRAARIFGMRIIGVRRSGRAIKNFDEMYRPERLTTALQQAHVVVISAPLTPETRNLIGDRELAVLRADTIFVNVSRGGIVDEDALLRVLKEGKVGGAILDVFQNEPLPDTSEFWSLENVLVTPHISSEAFGWEDAVTEIFCDNLIRWHTSEQLRNVVDPAAGY